MRDKFADEIGFDTEWQSIDGDPFASVITGANVHDSRLVSATFEKALQF